VGGSATEPVPDPPEGATGRADAAEFVPRGLRPALERARAAWAAADPARCAAQADCCLTTQGVNVRFFGRPHVVSHPSGDVSVVGEPAPAAVTILLLHYLLHADGTLPTGEWSAFRDLPDGLFYASAVVARAEAPLARAFGARGASDSRAALERFRAAASAAGGTAIDLADAAYAFTVFPRLRIAVLVWAGDADFPAEARLVFEATAGHYLPAEDLAGVAGMLSRRLRGGAA
jgi:hypothetical protein